MVSVCLCVPMIVFGKHAVTRLVARQQQLLPSMLELNEFSDRGKHKHKNRNNSATYQDIYDPFI